MYCFKIIISQVKGLHRNYNNKKGQTASLWITYKVI